MAKKDQGPNTESGRAKGGADFPKFTLESTLKVPTALEEKNGGNPLPPMDVAFAVELSPGSSTFRDILSASIKYGLTAGSFNQARVSLEQLGRDIVEPKSPEERRKALFDAAFRPEVFRRVYDSYRGKKLPDQEFFKNTVARDFGVAKEQAAKFVEVFTGNIKYLGLVKESSTGKWLSAESSAARELDDRVEQPIDDLTDSSAELPFEQPKRPPQGVSAQPPASPKQAIFVGHGKNKTPLTQLEKVLQEYKIPYKIAIDEPNKGRPISEKVGQTMDECGSAIIIFTADEEFKDVDGNTIYRPSENAVFELGAASVLYGSRIIVFKQNEVNFPTNFRDIGHISFEKDNLGAKVNELFRELIGFGLIKISVGA